MHFLLARLATTIGASRSSVRAMSTYTLYDMPVSNNGARVRMIIYYKDAESEVNIVPPSSAGGLQSDEYRGINPQCKMPALASDGLCVPESDTIARYLGGKLDGREGPGKFALKPGSDLAVKSDRICRLHDVYLAAIQGCMYKAAPVGQGWAMFGTRDRALDAFVAQLGELEAIVDDPAPYMLGDEPTQADVACFPTLLFAERMLPKFDKPFALGPKLQKWWDFMCSGRDAVATRVRGEITEALDAWDRRDRWGTVLGAGLRDDAPSTIFDKIIAREIPSDVVYEDDVCLAFKDINPVAPAHIILIPKHRDRLTQLQFATDDHVFVLGHLMAKVGHIAKLAGLDSYRLVVNDGAQACQSVFHLHLHIIGGRDLSWPPG
ncbi:hypothetical protein CTAYLR_004128 [Chrysophaeum taylorii]|uniref:Uncharacterized protein n=1 Tax=Chrysophaeum taylorii TaxID=2483200 RepID=A0AAD7UL90_9STRA|nr:hypothetical protein CTAYLR_004128 [Chrysophaeum taylorii]